MDISSHITLISKEGDRIIFKNQLTNLAELILNSNYNEDIPVAECTTSSIKEILAFCEAHNYDQDSMKYMFPFTSVNLEQHLDPISYNFIIKICPNNLSQEARIQILSPLLDTAFYLGFSKLKKIINTAIQVPFYCGATEEEQEEFKAKWNIQSEEISDEVLKHTAIQFAPLFHAYRESTKGQLQAIYDQYQQAKKN